MRSTIVGQFRTKAAAKGYRVKPDQFCYSWDYKVRDVAPNPAVNRTGEITNPANFVRAKFIERWQFFWADLLAMKVYGKRLLELGGTHNKTPEYLAIVDLFSDLSTHDRFLNNKWGTDNCNNYVADIYRGGDPVIDPLICADSIVEVEQVQTSAGGITSGLKMAKVKAFDVSGVPPIVTAELLANDRRVLKATVINKDGSVDDFPQIIKRFPWLPDHSVPYPLIAVNECWFYFDDLQEVA